MFASLPFAPVVRMSTPFMFEPSPLTVICPLSGGAAAVDLVEIGDHCMFANGCFVTDANHRFDDPDQPITWQGFSSKGPTRVGDNVWCGANVVITSGVTVGERSVIGANSVVTTDVPPFSIAAGAPAKVLRRVEYEASASAEND